MQTIVLRLMLILNGHFLGVRAMALWLIMIEIACIVISIQLVPESVYFLVPIFSVGIICHVLLFTAVHK